MKTKAKKGKTLTFDGADKCYVCESINATGLKPAVHPALPWAVCERCQNLTPLDFMQEKDPEKKKRIGWVVGAPLVARLFVSKLSKLIAGRSRKGARR